MNEQATMAALYLLSMLIAYWLGKGGNPLPASPYALRKRDEAIVVALIVTTIMAALVLVGIVFGAGIAWVVLTI